MSTATWAVAGAGVSTQLRTLGRRTRGTTAISVVAHLVLLLLLHLADVETTPPEEGLVEITWIEAPAPAPAIKAAPVERAAPVAQAPEPSPTPKPETKRFPRKLLRAESEPKPQLETATRDVVQAKLATVDPTASENRMQVASLLPQTTSSRPKLAGTPTPASPRPTELSRGAAEPRSTPSELARSPAPAAEPAPELARLVDEPVTTKTRTEPDAQFPPREVLSGVSMAGPASSRKLVTWRLPDYPEWAKSDAVEGSVRLRFVVSPNGVVKQNVMVERTSGFEDFDRNAVLALLEWQFEPAGNASADQWGSITLDYRLGTAP